MITGIPGRPQHYLPLNIVFPQLSPDQLTKKPQLQPSDP